MPAEPVDLIKAAHKHLGSKPTEVDAKKAQTPRLIIKSLAKVEPEPVSWLWEHHLARSKLSLLGGHPGVGKCTLTAFMAATISNGGDWPDGSPCDIGNVLFLLAEDELADTLRPRLDWHGADRVEAG